MYITALAAILLQAGCSQPPMPRPYAYFRIDLPEHAYTRCDVFSHCEFDMSAYGQWGEWHTSMFDDAECRNDPKSKLYKKSEEEIRQIQVETMERMSRQYTDTTAVFGGQMSRYSTNLYSNYFS